MDIAEGLERTAAAVGDACPRCAESCERFSSVTAATLGGIPMRRCPRCGTRFGVEAGRVLLAFTCESCGLPFLDAAILPHGAQRCPGCRAGETPLDLPDRDVALATETEIRSALAARWSFVGHRQIQNYLDRLAARVAERIDDAPREPQVVLVNEPGQTALALPSGTILMSVDLLRFLEDEAELVFVLGHELAHAASGEAAVRLSRLGFRSSSTARAEDHADAWAGAAEDLLKTGYGRRRARDADARAFEAMEALGYDPGSALRFLGRLARAIESGDPGVAHTSFSHPPAAERQRKVEKTLYVRHGPTAGSGKINREVFRRAIPKPSLDGLLRPVRLDLRRRPSAEPAPARNDVRRALTIAAVIVVVAAAIATAVVILAG